MTTQSLRPRRQPGIRFFLTLAACLCAVFLALPLSAQAAFPGGNGRIAFDRPDDGPFYPPADGMFDPPFTISSIHPRGGKVSFLTRGHSVEYSPDGRRIAYLGRGWSGIYVANADGSDPEPVTEGYNPHWSPDGRSLVFYRVDEEVADDAPRNLYTVRVDGSGERRLAEDAGEPAWSPDGRLIAYTSGSSVFTVRPDGKGRRRLTSTRHGFGDLDWAPDGRSLVVVHDRDFHHWYEDPPPARDDDILRISRSGRSLGRIVSVRGIGGIALSPDGRQLVFGRYGKGADRLYRVSAQGGRPRALTAGRDPSWQPVRPSAAGTRSSR